MKILWCVTGAGHLLEESVAFMEKISSRHEITVAMSDASLEVARMYALYERIKKRSDEIILEKDQGRSFPFVGRMYQKEFRKILVIPCSANTTAKIAHGIADTLITNVVSHGVKNSIPVLIFPTDFQKTERTTLPNGKKVNLKIRDIDLENTKKISKLKGIKVVRNFEEIKL